jgi:hypothetical protein
MEYSWRSGDGSGGACRRRRKIQPTDMVRSWVSGAFFLNNKAPDTRQSDTRQSAVSHPAVPMIPLPCYRLEFFQENLAISTKYDLLNIQLLFSADDSPSS